MKTNKAMSLLDRCRRPFQLLPVLAATLIHFSVHASVPDYVALVTNTPNLVAYWHFDPVFQTNSMVNGYQGTNMGAAIIGAAGTGLPLPYDPTNQALVLDGTNGFLCSNLYGQITNQGSVLAWLNLAVEPSTAGHFYQITAQSANGNDFDFQFQTDNSLYFFTDSGSCTIYAPGISSNQWHLVGGTFVAGGTRAIYVDGVKVTNSTAGGHSVNNTHPLTIGENIVFTGRHYKGKMSEVAIFNRALTAKEIGNIYAAGQPLFLNVTPAAGANVLTWPTNFTGYVLQTNGNLANASGWSNLPAAYSIVSTNYAFTNASGANRLFYRLVH
ncbi:MAG TPA: LamG domain-containing protein [Verrucomicrobiae bacterium]